MEEELAMALSTLIACPDCDLLQRLPELAPGGSARCPRCGNVLLSKKPDSLNRTLALTIAAAVAFVVANAVPMLGLEAAGREASTTVLGGVQVMWAEGQPAVSAIMLFAAVVAPALDIALMLTILLAVRRPPAPWWVGTLLRYSRIIRPWRMVEVMLLGILVSLIKIAELATVITGIAMWAVAALIVLLAAMSSNFDPDEVWLRVEWAERQARRYDLPVGVEP
jgi:paraquat-inducible protein A